MHRCADCAVCWLCLLLCALPLGVTPQTDVTGPGRRVNGTRGASVELQCPLPAVGGSGRVRWFRGSSPVPSPVAGGASSGEAGWWRPTHSLTLHNVSDSDRGLYTCVLYFPRVVANIDIVFNVQSAVPAQ